MSDQKVEQILIALGEKKPEFLTKPAREAADVIRILREYQQDMKNFTKYAHERNYLTPDVDRSFHTTAMYDATKSNLFRGLVALGAGLKKEINDFPGYYRNKGFGYAVKEGVKDYINDLVGVGASWFNPNTPAEKNNYLKNLQTPTMRAIMPTYRSTNDKKDL